MRVLSLIWGFCGGGIDKVIMTYTRLGEVSDIEVDTVCIHGSKWKTRRDLLESVDATRIEIRNRLDLSWISRASRVIEEKCPDLVFVHGFNGPVVARLCQRHLKRNFPFVCSYHGLYHAPRWSRLPLQPVFNGALRYIYRHHTKGVVAVAEHCRDFLIARQVPAEKIVTIHNGLPPRAHHQQIPTRAEADLKEDDFVIGVASRLAPIKGINFLIEAFARVAEKHSRARLLILGRGTREEQLQQQCARLGIAEKVRFVGYQTNVDAWHELFDIFALPSLAEYHSIGLLEAMRAGKAIVATSVGGNPESVLHEQHALLVPPANPPALERALHRLAGDTDLRSRLGQAASERFAKEFTEERTLEKTAEWLKTFHGSEDNPGGHSR